VNLIGDHTDYTGGLVFPMAIDRGTTIEASIGGTRIELSSDAVDGAASIGLPVDGGVDAITPEWARFVAAMARRLGATTGLTGTVSSNIPAGAGLSSSAALECAVGLALGFTGSPTELAVTARDAEHDATGVPTGIMDQLCIASGRAGHATLIDCRSLHVTYVPIAEDVDVVVEFVAHRTLVGSGYADRVAECAAAEEIVGPLRDAREGDLGAIADATVRRRARHVVTENGRVLAFAAALRADAFGDAGALMAASHASLRDDYEVSTPAVDDAVAFLARLPGVFGVRLTGGGFGGCIVALTERGALPPRPGRWLVRAADGARVLARA
jgi:galactokinase